MASKGLAFMVIATKAVQAFADFTADNDPYGEHDFGCIVIAGDKLF